MKSLLNQRGYALLIVLLTIIIFLSVSAVFISASLSHVNQEKTIDMNNQAVVAAEMGTKYLEIDIIQKVNSQYKYQQDLLKESINNLSQCQFEVTVGCKSESEIETLMDASINDFEESLIKTYFEDYNDTKQFAENVNYKISREDDLIKKEEYILKYNTFDDIEYYTFKYKVSGNYNDSINTEKSSNLFTTIYIPVPDFINELEIVSNTTSNPVSNNPAQLNNYYFDAPVSDGYCTEIVISSDTTCTIKANEKIDDIKIKFAHVSTSSDVSIIAENFISSFCHDQNKNKTICNNPLAGVKIYVNENISISDFKNIGDGIIILNGKILISSSGNNFNGTLVTEGFDALKNVQNISGNLFIKGNYEKDVTLNFNNQVSVKEGKLCINADGINITNSQFGNLGSKSNGILYFSSLNEEVELIPNVIRYTNGNYESFVRHCLGNAKEYFPEVPISDIITPVYNTINEESKIEVKY